MSAQTILSASKQTRVLQSEANRRLALRVAQKAQTYGATVALFSGTHAGLLGGHRVSDDVDFWVPNKHVAAVCEAFPGRILRAHDRTIITVDDQHGKLELMGNMVIHTQDEFGHAAAFPFHMSRQAQRRTRPGEIDGWTVRYADPVDTIMLKAILQRGIDDGKHDIRDIAAIAANANIDQSYLRLRIRETQSIDRVGALLEDMGVLRSTRRLELPDFTSDFSSGFQGLRESLVG